MPPCHPFRPVPGQCGPNRRGPLPAPPFDPNDYWATKKFVSSLFGSLETRLDNLDEFYKVDVVDPGAATEAGQAADAKKTREELNRILGVASNAQATAESKADKATTLAGYGITDAATKTEIAAKADLADGKVPAFQLPSYVDDVLEYDTISAFPDTGESSKIYVAKDTNLVYRWSGTQYVEISPSPVLDDTVTEASSNGVKSSGIWSWVKSLLPQWLTSDYAEPATVASVETKADASALNTVADKAEAAYHVATGVGSTVYSHVENRSNPHAVTAAQIGAYTRSETDAKLDDKRDKDDLAVYEVVRTENTDWTWTSVDSEELAEVLNANGAKPVYVSELFSWDYTGLLPDGWIAVERDPVSPQSSTRVNLGFSNPEQGISIALATATRPRYMDETLGPAKTNQQIAAVATGDEQTPANGDLVKYDAENDRFVKAIAGTDYLPLIEDSNGEKTAVTIGRRIGTVGPFSIANGNDVTASEYYSHAEGSDTVAAGATSHAEGLLTIANGQSSHAEGRNTSAHGSCSHTEGCYSKTRTNDDYAFAWNGDDTKTVESPYTSHGAGTFNINPAGGLYGFFIGEQTLAAILTNKADEFTKWVASEGAPSDLIGQPYLDIHNWVWERTAGAPYFSDYETDPDATSLNFSANGFTATRKRVLRTGDAATPQELIDAISTNNPAFVSAVQNTPTSGMPEDMPTDWGTFGAVGTALAALATGLKWCKNILGSLASGYSTFAAWIASKLDRASLLTEYSATSAYSVGAIVYYDGEIYQCKTAIADGGEAWNADHWELRKLDDFFTESNSLLTGTIDAEIVEKGTAPDAHLEAPTDEHLKLILADNSVAYDSAKALPYKLTSAIGDRVIATMTLTAASTDITLPTIAANDTTVKDFILDVTNAYAVEGVATDAGINIPRTDFKLVTRDGESLTDVTTVKAGKSAFICFTQKSPVVVDSTTYSCWCVIQLPFGDPS